MCLNKTTEGGVDEQRKAVEDKSVDNDLWRKKTSRVERQDLYVLCFQLHRRLHRNIEKEGFQIVFK